MIRAEIHKRLRQFQLGIRFQVSTGETLAIVGPSGSGKTTTLDCIAGLVSPDRGVIELGGETVLDTSRGVDVAPEHRRVGYVFQDYALFPHLSVFDNVAYGLRARRVPADRVQPMVADVLDMLGVAGLARANPQRLSGGERQRVALARAIVGGGRALLLDEPLGALDATTRRRVRTELRRLLKQMDAAAVFVTHDYADALAFGHRILVLDRGEMVQEGTRDELLLNPRSRFVADFTGVNYFEGRTAAGEGQPRRVQVGETTVSAVTEVEGEVSLSILPTDVMLSLEEPHASARNVVRGTVRDMVHLGDRVRVHLDAGFPLVAEVTAEACRSLGVRDGVALYAFFKATAVRVLE